MNIDHLLSQEQKRQLHHLELIASENFTSPHVRSAMASFLTHKYAEGYPGKRYYAGCEHVDMVEEAAISSACQLFNCEFANVQPHSGAQANLAVFFALLSPGDCFLGPALSAGGHLTHGASVTLSGRWFNAVHYGVHSDTHLIDYDEIRDLALKHRPKLLIAGWSAYPRQVDFSKFRQIADEVGAFLMVDMAHIAGLVATGLHPSPLPHADVVTTTTHKTLRGPRGGMILISKKNEISKKINQAVFPGVQGGPLMHVIAAKAIAFEEALRPEFKKYIQNVIDHAKILAHTLHAHDVSTITHGTDNHMVLVDLRKSGISGAEAENRLLHANLICNKNTIPFDTRSPREASGIRLGTAAETTRGLRDFDFKTIAQWISQLIHFHAHDLTSLQEKIKKSATQLSQEYGRRSPFLQDAFSSCDH